MLNNYAARFRERDKILSCMEHDNAVVQYFDKRAS